MALCGADLDHPDDDAAHVFLPIHGVSAIKNQGDREGLIRISTNKCDHEGLSKVLNTKLI